MADIRSAVKNLWMKGMEAVGNTASNIASNTRFKVDEMNLLNRRKEILSDFGEKAYALWQKGESFPEELKILLAELEELDEKLNDMRAERFAVVSDGGNESPDETADGASETSSEGEQSSAEAEAESDGTEACAEASRVMVEECEAAPEQDSSENDACADTTAGNDNDEPERQKDGETASEISEAIDELFEETPPAEDMAMKVNSSLDAFDESLKRFDERAEDNDQE